ncbi:MAG: ATP-binding protein, partial [Cyanobacteria bacterium J06626_23]
NAAISNNPLLRQRGAALDPAMLFGLEAHKTRISILNFIGLPGLPQQQQFLNQLAMTLFTWIKKNPAPAGVPLRGLLVIDEAKDFLPSLQTTACKSSLNRLAAQARKYGLGLIFATQAPKSIDHNVVANCSTQFYGRANSPSAIEVVRDQLRQRGGDGFDIAKLGRGQFYAVSESLTPPVKLLTPLCLSHHPSSPLDENAVLKRAQASRQ